MPLFQDNPLAFLLSTAVLLITTSCFLAISISLHSAYLWLAVVFVALIFLATFTCTYSLPDYFVHDISPNSAPQDCDQVQNQRGQTNITFESETSIPFWIPVDLPPPYDVVMGINPPSYSKATGEVVKPPNCRSTTGDSENCVTAPSYCELPTSNNGSFITNTNFPSESVPPPPNPVPSTNVISSDVTSVT